jgi:hypothetical protein
MKSYCLLPLLPVLLLASCATSSPVGPVRGIDDNHGISSAMFRHSIDHQKDDWDPVGIWFRVNDSPPTYLPRGTPANTPLDAAHGTLYVDAVDGWRFFVPKGGSPGYSEGILRGQADKITNDITRSQQSTRNAMRGAFFLPLMIGHGFLVPGR